MMGLGWLVFMISLMLVVRVLVLMVSRVVRVSSCFFICFVFLVVLIGFDVLVVC